jgi:hypothetical protein
VQLVGQRRENVKIAGISGLVKWHGRKSHRYGQRGGPGMLFARFAACSRRRVESPASNAVWIVLAALASLFALVQTARIAWTRFARSWSVRERARRAGEGELRAEPMLRAAGYEVLDRQVRGGWTVYADGEPLAIGLRADLLVARGGRRYIAEVKTGKLAPRLDHAATRRQLLEYRVAFGVDGILLVDAEAERVTVVELGERGAADPEESRRGFAFAFTVLLTGISIGVVMGWFFHAR